MAYRATVALIKQTLTDSRSQRSWVIVMALILPCTKKSATSGGWRVCPRVNHFSIAKLYAHPATPARMTGIPVQYSGSGFRLTPYADAIRIAEPDRTTIDELSDFISVVRIETFSRPGG
jgi:hypothetical protein